MEVEVSVIVSVYNDEGYLSACLDSLLGQTLREIQVICVDDCSMDNSLLLLNDYAARDARIEVYRMAENSVLAHGATKPCAMCKDATWLFSTATPGWP